MVNMDNLFWQIKNKSFISELKNYLVFLKEGMYDEHGQLLHPNILNSPIFDQFVEEIVSIKIKLDFIGVEQGFIDWIDRIFLPSIKNIDGIQTVERLNHSMDLFYQAIEPIIMKTENTFANFNKKELHRIEEGITCFENGCYTAAVVMAVSSVEARLHRMLKEADEKIYMDNRFEDKTLGELIKLFEKKEYTGEKYAKMKQKIETLPQIYTTFNPLINQTRIMSAHPKGMMDKTLARSVISLCCNFLINQKTQVIIR